MRVSVNKRMLNFDGLMFWVWVLYLAMYIRDVIHKVRMISKHLIRSVRILLSDSVEEEVVGRRCNRSNTKVCSEIILVDQR